MAQENKWRSNISTQGNSLERVEGYTRFLELWPFFLEGHEQQVETARMPGLTTDELFKSLLEIAVIKDRGFLGVLFNKKGFPLGYVAAHDTTIGFRPKEMSVYVIYTTKKCPSTTRELVYELKQWARTENFVKLNARMFKRSGAAVHFFTNTLRMRLSGMVFEQAL
jgi:hypothetical protein